jgi:transmembrane protein TMEM260 (protein O-mannosyltransferase)
VRAARPLVLLAAFALPAAVYVACVSPEPGAWDTAELQGVPYILGISHPTGFPLYVLLGFAWSHAIAIGSVAWRMNVMSAVVMAVVGAAGFGVALEFGASMPVALVATLWFSFTQNVWSHAIRAEAQNLAVVCCALAVYAFVRWLRGARDRWFVAAFALAGLGMAAHPNALWILPALLGGAAIAKRRPPARIVAGSFGLVIAGLLLYAYLPLRSAYVVAHHLDPASALPGYRGGIFWNYNNPSTPSGLALELTGTESKTPSYFLASLNPVHLGTALWTFVAGLRSEYGIVAAALAVAGFGAACRRDWRGALVLGVACTAGLVFSVVYPNESDVGRYRLLASWIAVPLFGALTPQSRRGFSLVLHVALIVFLLAGAAMSFQRQLSFFRHAPAEGGRWVISNVRPYVPPGAVIVTTWLDATSLAYGAYVDGTLPGRIVLSDDRFDGARYRGIAKSRRVFVLVNPHQVKVLNGAEDYATLDPYHELYTVTP